jgi:hypothetical protein
MLREIFELCLSRGSRLARQMGHDREAVSIAARHRRQHAAWAPHLEATRQLIRDAAAACPGRGTALILGSGLCLDVPLAQLAGLFATVVLVDAHHPRPARILARSFPNVRCLEADLTGLARTAVLAARGKAALPRAAPIPDLTCGTRPDLTASVNLASQLPIPFANLLGAHFPETLGRALVEAHFTALARQPGRVCLTCDVAWERIEEGKVVASRDALAGARHPEPERVWSWDIAPRPEESFSHDRRNLVHGWLDFAAAWRGAQAPGPAA